MAMKFGRTPRKRQLRAGLRSVEIIRASYRKNPEFVCPTKGEGKKSILVRGNMHAIKKWDTPAIGPISLNRWGESVSAGYVMDRS